MQKGWGFSEVIVDIRQSFTVGEHAVYWGNLKTRSEGSDAQLDVPFTTVLRVENGRVAERTDCGEYIVSHGIEDRWAKNTATTRRVASAALRAYTSGGLDAQSQLNAPDVVYQDPTAQVFGASNGQRVSGLEALLRERVTCLAGPEWSFVRDPGVVLGESTFGSHGKTPLCNRRFAP